MARPGTWTDEQQTVLERLHGEGRSLHSIAAELGVSKGTVGRHAERVGLKWPVAPIGPAIESAVAYGKRRRAELGMRLIDESHAALDRLNQPYVFVGGSKDGPVTLTLLKPDARATRDLMATATDALKGHIEAQAQDAESSAQTRSVLGRLGERLGIKPPGAEA